MIEDDLDNFNEDQIIIEEDLLDLYHSIRCKKCFIFLITPYSIPFEEGYFCEKCVKLYGTERFEVIFSSMEKELLSRIILSCKYVTIGCLEKRSYFEAKSILEHQINCIYKEVKCPHCFLKFLKKDLQQHSSMCSKFMNLNLESINNQTSKKELNLMNLNLESINNQTSKKELNLSIKKEIKRFKKKKKLKVKVKKVNNEFNLLEENIDDEGKNFIKKGIEFLNSNQYNDSLNCFEKSLDYNLKNYGEINENTINSYFHLGQLYKEICNYERALKNFNKAISITDLLYDSNNSLEKADLLCSSSNILFLQDQFIKAESNLREALDIRMKVSGENSKEVIMSYNLIANHFLKISKYDEALKFVNTAIDISLQKGSFNLEYAESQRIMGDILSDKRNFDLSIHYYEKALIATSNILTANHIEISFIYDSIAFVYINFKDHKNALRYFNKSLEIRKHKNKKNLSISYFNLGFYYSVHGNLEIALKNYEECLRLRKEIYYGKGHIDIAKIYMEIGSNYYLKKKEFDNASEYIEMSIFIAREMLGDSHTNLACLNFRYGEIFKEIKNWKQAIEYNLIAINILTSRYLNNPDLGLYLFNIGKIYFKDLNYGEALHYVYKSSKIFQEVFNENHEEIANTLYYISKIKVKENNNKNNEEIKKNLFKALEIKLKNNSDNLKDQGRIYKLLGDFYIQINKPDNAIKYNKKAYEILEKISDKKKNSELAFNIGKLYENKSQLYKALEFKEKALKHESNQNIQLSISRIKDSIANQKNDKKQKDRVKENENNNFNIKKE